MKERLYRTLVTCLASAAGLLSVAVFLASIRTGG